MKDLPFALIVVALIAAAVALIVTHNGDWVFLLGLVGGFLLFG